MEKLVRKLEKKYKLSEDDDFKRLVNFSNYRDEPFQRWFYYQEGYSGKLLDHLLEKEILPKNIKLIVDPFCGSGSTLISAKQRNIKSIGIDINPVSSFMAKVKTRNYTKNEIAKTRDFVLKKTIKNNKNLYKKYELRIIENLFNLNSLTQIEDAKKQIGLVKDLKVKDLLFATLISVLESSSNYKKAGNGLKKKKIEPSDDFRNLFHKKKDEICNDISNSRSKASVKVFNGGCELVCEKVDNNSADLFLFSPPYANCFDYFEVYKIELWLANFVSSYKELRKLRKTAMVSNLNADLSKEYKGNLESKLFVDNIKLIEVCELHDKRIPKMIKLYFQEMNEFIKTAYSRMRVGGKMIIVVGNSSYGGQPLLTDLILTDLAIASGFAAEKIIVARKNETSSQQYKKIGEKINYIRESLIVLRK